MKFNTEFNVEVKRTNRQKTIALKIQEGKVQIIVPRALSNRQIKEVLQKRTRWIKSKLEIQKSFPRYKPKKFETGESFLYLGKTYKLEILSGKLQPVILEKEQIIVTIKPSTLAPQRQVQRQLKDWYRIHACAVLKQKTELFARQVKVNPEKILIKNYKSRWGSCSISGEISYNWKIIMAPLPVIEYVIIHELCHLLEHNHSPQYWKIVETALPDYKLRKEWLKKNTALLEW